MNPLLVDQLAMYSAYHRDARNRATHFIGVPAIAFAILVPLGWGRFAVGGVDISLAMLFVAATLAFYLHLDRALALASAAVFLPVLALAEWVAGLGAATGWTIFALFFVGGWLLQLVGHGFEGRRPALLDNLLQIFIAPIFLIAEVFIALGLKRDLAAAVAAKCPRYMAEGQGARGEPTV